MRKVMLSLSEQIVIIVLVSFIKLLTVSKSTTSGGHYCGTPGSPDVDGECQAGHYCESGVDTATPTTSGVHTGTGGECPLGSFCPQGSTVPIVCNPGSYAGVTG